MRRRELVRSGAAAAALGVTGCLHGDGDRDGDGDDGDAKSMSSTSFEVVDSRGDYEVDVEVEWNEDDQVVSAVGVIEGNNLCYDAGLDDASYDADADELVVEVSSYEDADADESCGMQMVGLEYEFTAEFEGGLPETVKVVHDGRQTFGFGESYASEGNAGGQ